MSQPLVIDPAAIDSLKAINPDDGGEFVREIIQIFMEDTPARISELDEALACGDLAKFVRAAHSVKGSASNMGAMLVKETAEELERKSRDAGLGGVDPLLAKLKQDFALTAKELESY